MKLIITLILSCCLSLDVIYAQEINYNESVKSILEQSIIDCKEHFFFDLGANVRTYYNCSDTLFLNNCLIKRRLRYDENRRILSDTSFIDTLFSSINKNYFGGKIEIIKTHPEPSFLKYVYKTTTDSIIIDSLQRPIKYFKQGILSKTWKYDNYGRLIYCADNPEDTLYYRKILYLYLPDKIIITTASRSISEFDSSSNYLMFDNRQRLILDISKGNHIKYKNLGCKVFLDTIVESNVIPEKIDVKYQYIGDSIIISDNRISLQQIILLNSNREIKYMKNIMNEMNDTIECKYIRRNNKIIKNTNRAGELIKTEIIELAPNGKVKCKITTALNGKMFEKECYSESGLILQKTVIYNNEYRENLICKDEK